MAVVTRGVGIVGPGDGDAGTKCPVSSSIEVTKDQYDELLDACSIVREQFRAQVVDLVVGNYLELRQVIHAVGNIVSQAPALGAVDWDDAIFRLDVCLLNWAASFQIFLDHTRTRVTDRYGKVSPERERFEAATRAEFDRSFPYRLASKLRTFAVHCGMPPVEFRMTDRMVEGDEADRTERELVFKFLPDRLLSTWDRWGAPLTRDLRSQSEPIDVVSTVREAMHSLDRIATAVRAAEAPHIRHAAALVRTWSKRIEDEHGPGTPHAFEFHLGEEATLTGWSMTPLPTRKADDLLSRPST